MKTKNLFIVVVVAIALAIIFYSIQGTQDDDAYFAILKKEREEKDQLMRSSSSPFRDPASFKGLKYFPPDTKYRIIADLEPVANRKAVMLATSDGKEEHYLEYAHAAFNIDGVDCRLLILEMMESGPYRGKLFLAFGDETSADQTYGGGRYLDLNKTPGSPTIVLDFNKAYSPYCAYNETYSCPLPPAENLLKVAIKAGEMNYY